MAGNSKLTSRKKLFYVLVILFLIGLYALHFFEPSSTTLPTKARITEEKAKIRYLKEKLAKLEAVAHERDSRRETIKPMTTGFWPWQGRTTANEIQSRIQRIANQAGVELSNVSTPQIRELSDHIRAIEVTINTRSKTSIKSVFRFIRDIEGNKPHLLEFNDFTIRPNKRKGPTGVTVKKCKIRAFVLSKEASEYLKGT